MDGNGGMSPVCAKCSRGVLHPWHDNGTPTGDITLIQEETGDNHHVHPQEDAGKKEGK